MLDNTKKLTKVCGSLFFYKAKSVVDPLIKPLKLYEEVKAGRMSYSAAAMEGLLIPLEICWKLLCAVVTALILITLMFITLPMALVADAYGIPFDDSSNRSVSTI